MFGANTRQQFVLSPEMNPVNHGSYGALPRYVYDLFLGEVEKFYSFPDKYINDYYPAKYREAVKLASELLGSVPENYAIVDNATMAANVVLKSVEWKLGDKLLITDLIYASCKSVCESLEYDNGVEVIQIKVGFELEGTFVTRVEDRLSKGDIKAFFFDHVSAFPSFEFPVKDLADICKKYGVISMVDGAQGIGLVPIDILEIKPDFYYTNPHKWFYTPMGCSLLYVDPKFHGLVQPVPLKYVFLKEIKPDALYEKFISPGSKAYPAIPCFKKAYEYRVLIGGEESIREYSETLRDEVLQMIKQRWGDVVIGKPLLMVNVRIPFPVDMKELQETAIKNETFIRAQHYDGSVFIRLSFQIYNVAADYSKLLDLIETCKLEPK